MNLTLQDKLLSLPPILFYVNAKEYFAEFTDEELRFLALFAYKHYHHWFRLTEAEVLFSIRPQLELFLIRFFRQCVDCHVDIEYEIRIKSECLTIDH